MLVQKQLQTDKYDQFVNFICLTVNFMDLWNVVGRLMFGIRKRIIGKYVK